MHFCFVFLSTTTKNKLKKGMICNLLLISIGLLGVMITQLQLGVIVSHVCQLTLSGRYVAKPHTSPLKKKKNKQKRKMGRPLASLV